MCEYGCRQSVNISQRTEQTGRDINLVLHFGRNNVQNNAEWLRVAYGNAADCCSTGGQRRARPGACLPAQTPHLWSFSVVREEYWSSLVVVSVALPGYSCPPPPALCGRGAPPTSRCSFHCFLLLLLSSFTCLLASPTHTTYLPHSSGRDCQSGRGGGSDETALPLVSTQTMIVLSTGFVQSRRANPALFLVP